MAMSVSGLSAKIKAEVAASKGSADDQAKVDEMADILAKAIVEYIKANATVTVTGVSSGGSSAGGTVS